MSPAPILELREASFSYGTEVIFENLFLSVQLGEFHGIIGPNGAGKTTLLKVLAGILEPDQGTVSLFGRPIRDEPRMEVARKVAIVPQETGLNFGFSVFEVVLMGRFPHVGLLGLETDKDEAFAREALVRTGTEHLADRLFNELSGGERQLVVVARALAQNPRILLLDEPTASLDLRHQVDISRLLRGLCSEGLLTAVVVTHDVNFVTQHCTGATLFARGKVLSAGAPKDVVTPALLKDAFGVEVDLLVDPKTGAPVVVSRRAVKGGGS